MSHLTPAKPMTDFQLQSALDIIANHTMTLAQAEKLTRAISIDEQDSLWSPDIDDVADMFYKASKAVHREPYEMPYMGATISRLEALGTKG